MINSRRIKQVLSWPILPHILGVAGALIYSVQSIIYMFTQKSMIDEGLFLYKGYLFASGIYRPFQDYGPWMQKAPLVYLIPGYVETWFGPGLRAGRYYAVLISLLFLLGLWLVTRRLAGSLWAGLVICAVALNPSLIKAYSIAISQGLTSCLLVWTLFFALGKDRHRWQLAVSTSLVAILVFTRQNMICDCAIAAGLYPLGAWLAQGDLGIGSIWNCILNSGWDLLAWDSQNVGATISSTDYPFPGSMACSQRTQCILAGSTLIYYSNWKFF